MQTILTVIHLFLAIGLIGLILIQHGRGADAGAAFGSGASATVFGARGSGSFLSRTTAVLATLFFVTSVVMAYYAQKVEAPKGLMDGAAEAVQLEVPAVAPGAAGGSAQTAPGASPAAAPVAGEVQVPTPAPVAADVPAVPGAEVSPVQGQVPTAAGDVPAVPSEGGSRP
jgi:preprotein translocase subunit SecG